MKRSILILTAAAAVFTFGVTAPRPAVVEAKGETVADWDKKHKSNLKKAAKRWITLSKWCSKKKVEWTAMYMLRRVFLYTPDDEKVRKQMGYEKTPDGKWYWEEVAKENILYGLVDEDDPVELKVDKKVRKETKTIVKLFRSAARKANQLAAENAEEAGAWRSREKLAWEWVLRADLGNQEAHKALGHPEFDGRLVSPYALPFLKNRKARKEAAEKINAMKFETKQVDCSGAFVKSGMSGEAMQSEHVLVQTVHPKEMADGMCQSAEKALVDLVETYGFSENLKARNSPRTMDGVKDEEQYVQFLTKGAGWDEKKAKHHAKNYRGGTSIGPGHRMGIVEEQPAANDRAMNTTCSLTTRSGGRSEAIADVGRGESTEVEDWLWQSMAYDQTKRILGTAATLWADEPKYGNRTMERPGYDVWIGVAKQDVEMERDPPFSVFPSLTIQKQSFKSQHVAKGYAVIHFVFEKDTAEAQKFIRHAVAKGTEAAVKDVWGWTMDEFDVQYRKWLLDTHYYTEDGAKK